MTSKKKELFIDLNTIDPKEVEWLWEPFIPFSMITIMEGDPGVGNPARYEGFLASQALRRHPALLDMLPK